jgi:hypothetical protein
MSGLTKDGLTVTFTASASAGEVVPKLCQWGYGGFTGRSLLDHISDDFSWPEDLDLSNLAQSLQIHWLNNIIFLRTWPFFIGVSRQIHISRENQMVELDTI